MRAVALSALIFASIAIASCAKPDGASLFTKYSCTTCHRLNGVGTGSIDLANVKNTRTRQWVIDQIREPRKNRADTGMQSFAFLSNAEIEALADYVMK